MRPNREKLLALVALAVLVLGMIPIVTGVISPTRGIQVVPFSLPRTGREILPRRHRRFAEESEMLRDPFAYSEGWERLTAVPLDAPPLSRAPRPLPSLSFGAPTERAGFSFEADKLPPPKKKKGIRRRS